MIYWKYKFKFGKTTENNIKNMQDICYDIKTISYFYYLVLCFVKWVFMLILMPVYILFYVIYIIFSIVSIFSYKASEVIYNNFYKQ